MQIVSGLAEKAFVNYGSLRLVSKECAGVGFNFIIADRVADEWYGNNYDPIISWDDAAKTPMSISAPGGGWLEMKVWRELIRPGDHVVDCGCHHGLTAILAAASCGPSGFVTAVDAVLFNAMVTQAQFRANGLSNAAALCAAVGGKRGPVSLAHESNVIVNDWSPSASGWTVMMPLDDILPERVDVLKLDIEGQELAAMESSKRIGTIPRLHIELHTEMLPADGPERILKTLEGHRIFILDEEEETILPYNGEHIAKRVHLICER